MTMPTKKPHFFDIFPDESSESCSWEDEVQENINWRDFKDQARKCAKMRKSRVYSKIMSLAGRLDKGEYDG
jgi:hypothetical protein